MLNKYLTIGVILGLLIPPPLQAQEMTLKERLQTIRSARTIFYELDDYYREIKRNFSNKSKYEIMDIRRKNRSAR